MHQASILDLLLVLRGLEAYKHLPGWDALSVLVRALLVLLPASTRRIDGPAHVAGCMHHIARLTRLQAQQVQQPVVPQAAAAAGSAAGSGPGGAPSLVKRSRGRPRKQPLPVLLSMDEDMPPNAAASSHSRLYASASGAYGAAHVQPPQLPQQQQQQGAGTRETSAAATAGVVKHTAAADASDSAARAGLYGLLAEVEAGLVSHAVLPAMAPGDVLRVGGCMHACDIYALQHVVMLEACSCMAPFVGALHGPCMLKFATALALPCMPHSLCSSHGHALCAPPSLHVQVMYGLVASGYSPHPAFTAACERAILMGMRQTLIKKGQRTVQSLSPVQWRYAQLIYQRMGRGMGEELAVAMVASY